VDIQVEREVSDADLIGLYDAVVWVAYTRAPDTLAKAIANSSIVVTARDEDGELIGLARGLSDDASIFYLQDILVRPEHRRTGVGRQLLAVCLERYGHVRQKVVLTDDDAAQQRFYESLGYVNTTSVTGVSLNTYVRFDA
jgi:GNAT superfamily N-acetyltransferase